MVEQLVRGGDIIGAFQHLYYIFFRSITEMLSIVFVGLRHLIFLALPLEGSEKSLVHLLGAEMRILLYELLRQRPPGLCAKLFRRLAFAVPRHLGWWTGFVQCSRHYTIPVHADSEVPVLFFEQLPGPR